MSFTIQLVRALKGAPLSCYVLIMGAGRPVTNDWLIQHSGYTDKTVAQAVNLLSSPEYGLISREELGWMPIGETLMIFSVSEGGRNFSDSTTTILKDSISLPKEEKKKSRNFSDPQEPDQFQAVWKELARASVFKNNRTIELVRREYMTPEYVRAHVDAMRKRRKGGSQWAGVLVKMLEAHEPIPESVSGDDPSRYVSGAYADFIEH